MNQIKVKKEENNNFFEVTKLVIALIFLGKFLTLAPARNNNFQVILDKYIEKAEKRGELTAIVKHQEKTLAELNLNFSKLENKLKEVVAERDNLNLKVEAERIIHTDAMKTMDEWYRRTAKEEK